MARFNSIRIATVLFLLSPLFLSGSMQSIAEEPITKEMIIRQEAQSSESLAPQLAFPGEFDLEGCEQDCRSRYGIDPYFIGAGGGYDTSIWRLYTICIQECHRAYWKDFDRRMKKLGDSEKEDEQ